MREHDVDACGLRIHCYEWPSQGAEEAPDCVILCHGFLDHARAWDWVVDRLPPGWRIVAFDWRGHGASAWVPAGGTYHFADYLLDLTAVVDRFGGGRLLLVGHSMGGGVAAAFAGTFAPRVTALALLEGLGPPAAALAEAPERTAAFVLGTQRQYQRPRRAIASVDEAARRITTANPRIAEPLAKYLAAHGTIGQPDGTYQWRYDPMHRVPFAQPYLVELAQVYWRRVQCPVVSLEGAQSPFIHLADIAQRRAAFATLRCKVIENTGHMMHVETPGAVATALVDFWRGVG